MYKQFDTSQVTRELQIIFKAAVVNWFSKTPILYTNNFFNVILRDERAHVVFNFIWETQLASSSIAESLELQQISPQQFIIQSEVNWQVLKYLPSETHEQQGKKYSARHCPVIHE